MERPNWASLAATTDKPEIVPPNPPNRRTHQGSVGGSSSVSSRSSPQEQV